MPTPNPTAILDWYAAHQRDLPWRRADATPWAILVSEVMLQQTPVARVRAGLCRLAGPLADPGGAGRRDPGGRGREWGRLGYPRRALRLHMTAQALVPRHAGQVPAALDALLDLPGIGAYTAAAVASFAFGQRHPVLDTNVRRVLARVVSSRPLPPASTSAAEARAGRGTAPGAARGGRPLVGRGHGTRRAGLHRAPARSARSARWRATAPGSWPAAQWVPRPGAARVLGHRPAVPGRLLAVLRTADRPVPRARLDAAWPEPQQRSRALDSLVADGLVEPFPDGRFALPGAARATAGRD